MNPGSDRPVVIVGGGVSGLSLAFLLAENGVPTVVVEKEDRPGGLARSFTYDGFTFDIGPHRFHTYIPEVESFIRETMGNDLCQINRRSKLHFRGRFYPWPLHPSRTFLRFPPGVALSVIRDLLVGYPKRHTRSFKDQIINMYGETLYRHFFEGYSTKFLGIRPEETHPDWARTGVDRAIIDSRLRIQSLWLLAWTILTTWKKPEMGFLYPRGGCEQFMRNLAGRFTERGGELLCGRAVDGLAAANGRIEEVVVGERILRPSLVVWTGTIHSLAEGLGQPRPELEYLALVCFNLMLGDGRPFDFQWCYHGAADVLFSRISVPANFDPALAPPGRRSLCVEVTCGAQNSVWDEPQGQLDRVVADLRREGLVASPDEVLGVEIERIPWAYPIYELEYRDKLDAFQRRMAGYQNLLLAGRLGRFWYNNMDHCIEASLGLAEEVVARLSGE